MQVKSNDSYFLAQPHQPFFVLSIVGAIVFMTLFLLGYKGIVDIEVPVYDVLLFHVYTLAFVVFNNAFTGFLFTTFPRFNQTAVIEKSYYVRLFYINSAAVVLLGAGALLSQWIFVAGMLLAFIGECMTVYKLYDIYKASRMPDKKDSFWILTGNFFGLFGHLLFIVSVAGVTVAFVSAVNITVFLYLLLTAFSVAQRMIPFFSHSFAPKNERFVPVVAALLVAISLFASLQMQIILSMLYFVAALYMAWEIKRWELHPLHSPAILWILHLALFWLPLGFFLASLLGVASVVAGLDFYYIDYHLLLLGFLTTVLIGFGTRVILGHSGSVPHADTLTKAIFIMTQLVVLTRALYSFDIALGWGMPFLFDISATLWLVMFGIWGGRFFKVLVWGKQK